ncbi:MAG: hypothetical protein VB857_05860, partial [Pirellulaceae bacterium]
MIRVKRTCRLAMTCAALSIMVTPLCGQQTRPPKASKSYPPTLPGAKVEVYKKIGDVRLQAYIYFPKNHKPGDDRPVAVFFFGGGWRAGT